MNQQTRMRTFVSLDRELTIPEPVDVKNIGSNVMEVTPDNDEGVKLDEDHESNLEDRSDVSQYCCQAGAGDDETSCESSCDLTIEVKPSRQNSIPPE